jgi:hypothetical protein
MRAFLTIFCLAAAGEASRVQKAEAIYDGIVARKKLIAIARAMTPGAAFASYSPSSRLGGKKVAKRSTNSRAAAVGMDDRAWTMEDITPDGSLMQRVEGKTRKTWKFSDTSKDRVQVAVTTEGRPAHADIQLWLGPDWTPFMAKAYSEDGKLRPIQTLVGTRHKEATIEVRNNGEYEFPIQAASNYASNTMATVPADIPASTPGERVDGQALTSFSVDPAATQVEVVLKTDGKQLNARIELLNAPNNPKQTFEAFTNNGELNSLVVCFNIIDSGNTVRVVNLAPVEFPMNVHLNQIS